MPVLPTLRAPGLRPLIVALPLAAGLTLAGCQTSLTPQEQVVAGGLAGAAAGIVTARILNADAGWTILAGLGGAAIGTMVARNNATGQCAYKVGADRFETRPCPR